MFPNPEEIYAEAPGQVIQVQGLGKGSSPIPERTGYTR
jgi:hypothetical protein